MSDTPSDIQRLHGIEDNQQAALRLVQQADHEVRIMGHEFDRHAMATQAFVDACREFLLRSPRAQLRILVQDGAATLRNAPALIELLRNLSSRAQMRRLPDNLPPLEESVLLIDRGSMLHRESASRLEGLQVINTPLQTREHLVRFDELWEQSEPDPELRRLHI